MEWQDKLNRRNKFQVLHGMECGYDTFSEEQRKGTRSLQSWGNDKEMASNPDSISLHYILVLKSHVMSHIKSLLLKMFKSLKNV